MLEKLNNVVLPNVDIYLDDLDSDIATFLNGDMCGNTTDLNIINLDDNIFYEDGPISNVLVRLMDWHNRFKQWRAC